MRPRDREKLSRAFGSHLFNRRAVFIEKELLKFRTHGKEGSIIVLEDNDKSH